MQNIYTLIAIKIGGIQYGISTSNSKENKDPASGIKLLVIR